MRRRGGAATLAMLSPMSRQRLQVTLSAAKLGAKIGAEYEKACRGGSCLCIN